LPLEIEFQNEDIKEFYKKAIEKSKEKEKETHWYSWIASGVKSLFASDCKLSSFNDSFHELIKLALQDGLNHHLSNFGQN
jgi:hypothetical protein